METEEGIVGLGECSAASPRAGTVGSLKRISEALVGESPFDVERLLRDVHRQGSMTVRRGLLI